MRFLLKNETPIISDVINTKDTYYTCVNGDFTACKIKSFEIEIRTGSDIKNFVIYCKYTFLAAIDMEEYTRTICDGQPFGAYSISGNQLFRLYLSKKDLCEGKEYKKCFRQILEPLAKFMHGKNMFNGFIWNGVRACPCPISEAFEHPMPNLPIMRYDLLTDTLFALNEDVAHFISNKGKKVYFLKSACENDNVVKIAEFE